MEPPRKYRNWTPRRSVNYRHSPERVQARLSGRVILIFHYSTRSLLAAVRRTYGRTHRQINRPKRLRRGSCRPRSHRFDGEYSAHSADTRLSRLATKPTVPTRPLVRQKIVGPVHPAVNERILRPTLNAVSSIETELARVRSAWARYRATNSRDAVYGYLTAVFRVVTRWRRLNCAVKNSRTALRLQAGAARMKPEPFGIVIFCTADPEIVDAKTRSKWSRVLRYAARAKPASQRLTDFVKSNGGINECARKFARTARSASK